MINSLKELIWHHRWRVGVMILIAAVSIYSGISWSCSIFRLNFRFSNDYLRKSPDWRVRQASCHSTERLRRFVSWHLYFILQCRYHLLQLNAQLYSAPRTRPQMFLRGTFCSQVFEISYPFLSYSCTAPAPLCLWFFCSQVKYHSTNFCFTDTFRGTAVSVVSCLSKRGYYLQQRVHPPLTPVISHPEVRLST